MVAALYSSRNEGTKMFKKGSAFFGWSSVESVYKSDLYRAQQGITRRVPGLKYAYVVRDSWTRLNVLPAKIMQVCMKTSCFVNDGIIFFIATLHDSCNSGDGRKAAVIE